MKKWFIILLLFPALLKGYSPEESLGELFVEVQMDRIFSDSKVFVDAIPNCCPEQIVQIYKNCPSQDLMSFVEAYFTLPEQPPSPDKTGLKMEAYLDAMWDQLKRNSLSACGEQTTLLPLPRSYIVPGDRFREMYYWDSFFSMIGLALSDREELLEGMLVDFAYLVDLYGFIPNGNRSYYLSRSQPPFFSFMVELSSCPQNYLAQLEREYWFWIEERSVLGTLLSQYSDSYSTPRPEAYYEDVVQARSYPEGERAAFYHAVRATAESGWDFSSRWFDQAGELITDRLMEVDLNCLLYHEERLLEALYEERGSAAKASFFREQAERRREVIQAYFWDEEAGFYFDYNFVEGERSPHYTLAALFPLLVGIADERQAEAVVNVLKENFLFSGGLVTTLIESGEQWDYPNGWAPLQWVAVCGLKRYGFTELAEEIQKRWLKTNEKRFSSTGLMLEKYNVVEPGKPAGGGEYPLQFGFGWTNGVALYFLGRNPDHRVYRLFEEPLGITAEKACLETVK